MDIIADASSLHVQSGGGGAAAAAAGGGGGGGGAAAADDVEREFEIQFYEELTRELMEAERQMIQEYEKQAAKDARAEAAQLEAATSEGVFCPVCCKAYLFQNMNVIFCRCGFRLDCMFDGMTIANLQQQLNACAARHSGSCSGAPVFSKETHAISRSTHLVMRCRRCSAFEIVL